MSSNEPSPLDLRDLAGSQVAQAASRASVAVPAVAWTLEWAGRTGSRRIEPPVDPDHEQPRLGHRDTATGEHEAMVDAGAVPVEVDSAVDGRIDRRPTDDPRRWVPACHG